MDQPLLLSNRFVKPRVCLRATAPVSLQGETGALLLQELLQESSQELSGYTRSMTHTGTRTKRSRSCHWWA